MAPTDEIYLVLEGEEVEDGLLPRHTSHVHVVHLHTNINTSYCTVANKSKARRQKH